MRSLNRSLVRLSAPKRRHRARSATALQAGGAALRSISLLARNESALIVPGAPVAESALQAGVDWKRRQAARCEAACLTRRGLRTCRSSLHTGHRHTNKQAVRRDRHSLTWSAVVIGARTGTLAAATECPLCRAVLAADRPRTETLN